MSDVNATPLSTTLPSVAVTALSTSQCSVLDYDSLWSLLIQNQHRLYQTSGRGSKSGGSKSGGLKPGVAFTYQIRIKANGMPSGEMFIKTATGTQWSRKSITKSTVIKAYQNALQEQEQHGYCSGPKKLKTFGASYLYAVFKELGLVWTTPSSPLVHDDLDTTSDTITATEGEFEKCDPVVSATGSKFEESEPVAASTTAGRVEEVGNSQFSLFDMIFNTEEEEQKMAEEQNVAERKRTRRSGDEIRSAKIAAIEEKIEKKEAELAELKNELEVLKRPPQLSEREKQAMFKAKIEAGALTEEEAYQLGWKG